MQNIFTRVLDVENSPLELGTAVNIVSDSTKFVVRLLKANDKVSATLDCFTEEDLLLTDSLASEDIRFKINDAVYHVVDELIFELSTASRHFLKPLSNYLVLLQNNRLELVNFQLETAFSHYRVPQYIKQKSLSSQCVCLAQIYNINANDSFDKCCKSITRFSNVPLITNLIDGSSIVENTAQVINDNYTNSGTSGRNRLQAYLKLEPLSESVKPDDKVLFKVSCLRNGQIQDHANFTVCLEAIDGYLPHTRVRLENGIATFTAYALHLNPGESIRVKVGLHHYRGIAECIIPVIANSNEQNCTECTYVTSEELNTVIANASSKIAESVLNEISITHEKIKSKLYELQQELYDRTSS